MNTESIRPKSPQKTKLVQELLSKILWLSSMGLIGFGTVVILTVLISLESLKRELEYASLSIIHTLEPLFIEAKTDLCATSSYLTNTGWQDSEKVTQILQQMRSRHPHFQKIQLLGKNGSIITSQPPSQENIFSDANKAKMAWSSLAQSDESIYIAPLKPKDEQSVIKMVVPVKDSSGVIQSLLVAKIDISQLYEKTINQQVGQSGYIYLIDQEGTILVANNVDRVGQLSYIQNASNHPARVHLHQGIDGKTVLALVKPLQIVPWYAVVESPLQEKVPMFIGLGVIAVTLLSVEIIIVIKIIRFTRQRIVQPLNLLNQGVQELKEGNFQLLINIPQKDELGDLAQAFNLMKIKLQNSLETLEEAVQKRTFDLERAIQKLSFHFNNTPLAVIEWDQDGRVQNWSQQAEQVFGWQAQEVIGLSWRDLSLINNNDLPEVKQVIEQLTQGIQPRNVSSNRNYTKDGQMIYCEWYNSALFNRD